ncbi:MAG TPA: hypothetical protein VGM83_13125 [Devosiaceae bacterium]|jgi:hypothetical protein
MLAAQVRSILLDHWDPISIRNVPGARGKYDSYIGGLLRITIAGASAADIAARLFDIETGQMGLGGDRDRALYVAEKLIAANSDAFTGPED